MLGVWLLSLWLGRRLMAFLKAARMILPLSAPFFICFYPVRSRPPAALAVSEGDIGMTALFRAAI